jgi:hypothetical protein
MGKWTVASDAAIDTRRALERRLFGRDLTPQERKYRGLRLGWIDNDFDTQQEIADLLGMANPVSPTSSASSFVIWTGCA